MSTSVPWAFVGSWFPTVENVTNPIFDAVGDGSARPIFWDNTPGATSDDQICQFEWVTKTTEWTVSGTATVLFKDPSNPGTPAESRTEPFSFSLPSTPISGTTWDVNEPVGDLAVDAAAKVFSGSDTATIPVTLPWGSDNIIINLSYSVSGLYAVSGSGYASYVKLVNLAFSTAAQFSPSGGISFNTDKSFVGSTTALASGIYSTAFHSSAQFWYPPGSDPVNNPVSFGDNVLAVTEKLTAPADLILP